MRRRRFTALMTGIVVAAALFAAAPAFAAPKICKTPDGFVVADGKGIGGTGMPEERGIGGTGTRADIGIYGRITGFGSICVNGMRIRYGNDTPVSDMGESASIDHLQVGQIVVVQAYPDGEDYAARHIAVEQSVAGPISAIHPESGKMTVRGQNIFISGKNRDAMTALQKGDHVAVSGLRRDDGVIVAGHIRKIPEGSSGKAERPSFGADVTSFAVQGFIDRIDKGSRIHLGNGMEMALPEDMADSLSVGQRVLAFGHVDDRGHYHADQIVPESLEFPTLAVIAINEGENKAPEPAPHETQQPPADVAPVLPPVEIPAQPIDLPALPIEVPALPVDIPALPVDIPALPVDLPIPPVDIPLVPDLPLIP